MVYRITKDGTEIVGEVFNQGLLIMAHNVTIRNTKVDGRWHDDEMYGIKLGTTKEGIPFGALILDQVEVCNVWGKGILAGKTWIKSCDVHDIGSDGIFRQQHGAFLLEDSSIENLGYDPKGRVYKDETGNWRHEDRTGKPIHADGFQMGGGSWTTIRRNSFTLHQGYPAEPNRVGNACIYVEAQWASVTELLIQQNRLKGANHLVRIRDEPQGKPAWQDETIVSHAQVIGNKYFEPWAAAEIFETQHIVETRNNDATFAQPRKRL